MPPFRGLGSSPPGVRKDGHRSIAGKSVLSSSVGGRGKGSRGYGVGGKPQKRHRKILKDNLYSVTKGDIRRMARRGGIKRISSGIYDETRHVMKDYMSRVLKDICAMVDHGGRKTCTVSDVVWVLKRMGRPIYGFGAAEK